MKGRGLTAFTGRHAHQGKYGFAAAVLLAAAFSVTVGWFVAWMWPNNER